MRKKAIKETVQDKLMDGMRIAISELPASNDLELEIRQEAINQFRRVEKFFGYDEKSWSPFF